MQSQLLISLLINTQYYHVTISLLIGLVIELVFWLDYVITDKIEKIIICGLVLKWLKYVFVRSEIYCKIIEKVWYIIAQDTPDGLM